MFWLARLMRLARPIPPTPTPAMLRVSLGGTRPRPRTWRGTMQNAAAVTAESASNLRREIVLFSVMESPLRAARLARAQAKFTARAPGVVGRELTVGVFALPHPVGSGLQS